MFHIEYRPIVRRNGHTKALSLVVVVYAFTKERKKTNLCNMSARGTARPFNAFARVLSRHTPVPVPAPAEAPVPAPAPAPAVEASPASETAVSPAVKEQVANRWRDWEAERARSVPAKPADTPPLPADTPSLPIAAPVAAVPKSIPLSAVATRARLRPMARPAPAVSRPNTTGNAPSIEVSVAPAIVAASATEDPRAEVAKETPHPPMIVERVPSPVRTPYLPTTAAPQPLKVAHLEPETDIGDALSRALAKIAEQQALISNLVSTVASQCPSCCTRVVGLLTGSAGTALPQSTPTSTPRTASQHNHFHLSVDARPHAKGAARLRQKATSVRPNIGKRRPSTRSGGTSA